MIGPAAALGNDVVHREIPERELVPAPVAPAFLPAEELVLAFPVIDRLPDIRAPRNVRPDRHGVAPEHLAVLRAVQALNHELRRLG